MKTVVLEDKISNQRRSIQDAIDVLSRHLDLNENTQLKISVGLMKLSSSELVGLTWIEHKIVDCEKH